MARPLFIVNPASGAGRAREALPAIRAALAEAELAAEIVVANGPAHAEQAAEAAARAGFSPVVAVGGDGTVQRVATGLLRAAEPPPLGIVPAGTGDDFARGLGLPRHPAAAARLLFQGAVGVVDVMRCGERVLLNQGGVGLDATVAAAVERQPGWLRRARLVYLWCAARELWRFAPLDLEITLDTRRLRRAALLVLVANGRFCAGGMQVCPAASLTDGLLDVAVVGALPRLEALALLPRLFRGGHVAHPAVEFHRARLVRVEGPPRARAQGDGEPLGSVPLEFAVAPRRLAVVGAGRLPEPSRPALAQPGVG